MTESMQPVVDSPHEPEKIKGLANIAGSGWDALGFAAYISL